MFSIFNKWFSTKSTQLNLLFETALGENLHSLIQYGSSIRNKTELTTKINLLIVLNRSTPEAHLAIHQLLQANPQIEPFILGKRGFERTVLSFAVKFLSISRHYQVLSGEDVLKDLSISLQHERFLTEQALRNLRLKIVHCYATRGASKSYLRFINSLRTSIFVDISEVLRCEQKEVPIIYAERVTAFSAQFDFDVAILEELIKLNEETGTLIEEEIHKLHRNLFILLDNILLYIEDNWNEALHKETIQDETLQNKSIQQDTLEEDVSESKSQNNG